VGSDSIGTPRGSDRADAFQVHYDTDLLPSATLPDPTPQPVTPVRQLTQVTRFD